MGGSKRVLDGQLEMSLFEQHDRTPGWDDVHSGTAHTEETIEPCDRCYAFWHGGRCTHTPENYAFPKQRPNGMCLKRRIVWND